MKLLSDAQWHEVCGMEQEALDNHPCVLLKSRVFFMVNTAPGSATFTKFSTKLAAILAFNIH